MTPAEELDGLMQILNTIKPDSEVIPLSKDPLSTEEEPSSHVAHEVADPLIPPDLYQQIKDSPLMKPNEYSAPSSDDGATVLVPSIPGHDETAGSQPAKEARIAKPLHKAEKLFPAETRNAPALPAGGPESNSVVDTIHQGGIPGSMPEAAGLRLILTGRSGVGKTWLAQRLNAQAWEISSVIEEVLSKLDFASAPFHKSYHTMVQTLLAWGRGHVSDGFPLSPARLLFMLQARDLLDVEGFGRPDFWASLLVQKVADFSGPVVVTSVTSGAEFQVLQEAGFKHYHVVCSSATLANRQKRQGAPGEALAAHLDKQATEKLSNRKDGEKLKCVWNDAAKAHPRLYSVQEFLQEVSVTLAAPATAAWE
jgi:hypothetical protein